MKYILLPRAYLEGVGGMLPTATVATAAGKRWPVISDCETGCHIRGGSTVWRKDSADQPWSTVRRFPVPGVAGSCRWSPGDSMASSSTPYRSTLPSSIRRRWWSVVQFAIFLILQSLSQFWSSSFPERVSIPLSRICNIQTIPIITLSVCPLSFSFHPFHFPILTPSNS